MEYLNRNPGGWDRRNTLIPLSGRLLTGFLRRESGKPWLSDLVWSVCSCVCDPILSVVWTRLVGFQCTLMQLSTQTHLVESPEQDSNFTSNVSTLNAGKGGGTRRISSGTGTWARTESNYSIRILEYQENDLGALEVSKKWVLNQRWMVVGFLRKISRQHHWTWSDGFREPDLSLTIPYGPQDTRKLIWEHLRCPKKWFGQMHTMYRFLKYIVGELDSELK